MIRTASGRTAPPIVFDALPNRSLKIEMMKKFEQSIDPVVFNKALFGEDEESLAILIGCHQVLLNIVSTARALNPLYLGEVVDEFTQQEIVPLENLIIAKKTQLDYDLAPLDPEPNNPLKSFKNALNIFIDPELACHIPLPEFPRIADHFFNIIAEPSNQDIATAVLLQKMSAELIIRAKKGLFQIQYAIDSKTHTIAASFQDPEASSLELFFKKVEQVFNRCLDWNTISGKDLPVRRLSLSNNKRKLVFNKTGLLNYVPVVDISKLTELLNAHINRNTAVLKKVVSDAWENHAIIHFLQGLRRQITLDTVQLTKMKPALITTDPRHSLIESLLKLNHSQDEKLYESLHERQLTLQVEQKIECSSNEFIEKISIESFENTFRAFQSNHAKNILLENFPSVLHRFDQYGVNQSGSNNYCF